MVDPLYFPTDVVDARKVLLAYAFSEAPGPADDKLQAMSGSTADLLTQGAEVLYAHYDQLDERGLRTMASVFAFLGTQHLAVFDADSRCARIVNLVAVRLGLVESDELAYPEPITTWRDDRLDWRHPTPEPVIEEPVVEGE